MVFNMLFYIISGTNLLTGGPVPIFVFLPILEFRRKGIPNGVQTEWNFCDDLSWTRRLGDEVGDAMRQPRGWRARPYLVGPSWVSWPSSFAYIYSYTLKISRGAMKPLLHHRNLLYPWDPILGPFPASFGGGFDHWGLLHQHHCLSDEAWVVYHRPSGP